MICMMHNTFFTLCIFAFVLHLSHHFWISHFVTYLYTRLMLIARITRSFPSSLSSINLPTLNLREVYFTIINRRFFTIFYYNSKISLIVNLYLKIHILWRSEWWRVRMERHSMVVQNLHIDTSTLILMIVFEMPMVITLRLARAMFCLVWLVPKATFDAYVAEYVICVKTMSALLERE